MRRAPLPAPLPGLEPGSPRDQVQVRLHGHPDRQPITFLYLPGLHGDWTLLGPLRRALGGCACLVEVAYPCRSDWTLADYARSVLEEVTRVGAGPCWILGESYSSQVAWELLAQLAARTSPVASSGSPAPATPAAGFSAAGLILVGGFVRHPWPWGVDLLGYVSSVAPAWFVGCACRAYAALAGWRSGAGGGVPSASPEAACFAELELFVRRRADPADRRAINSRYRLIRQSDPRPGARAARLPVYQLSGFWDPLVPWWQVRRWLRRDCPGYIATRVVAGAGHNVLLGAAEESARQILEWSQAVPSPPFRAA